MLSSADNESALTAAGMKRLSHAERSGLKTCACTQNAARRSLHCEHGLAEHDAQLRDPHAMPGALMKVDVEAKCVRACEANMVKRYNAPRGDRGVQHHAERRATHAANYKRITMGFTGKTTLHKYNSEQHTVAAVNLNDIAI